MEFNRGKSLLLATALSLSASCAGPSANTKPKDEPPAITGLREQVDFCRDMIGVGVQAVLINQAKILAKGGKCDEGDRNKIIRLAQYTKITGSQCDRLALDSSDPEANIDQSGNELELDLLRQSVSALASSCRKPKPVPKHRNIPKIPNDSVWAMKNHKSMRR